MNRCLIVFGLVVCALSHVARAEDKHNHPMPKIATNAGFEKMKTLVGTWVAADEAGKPTDKVVSEIKLTAGGSAIQETIFPGDPMEMVSVYTAEGDGVLLTHYCMLGNQPRMKASGTTADKQLKFEFVGGANLDPKKDMHMHGATLIFHDSDQIEIVGVAWENGVPCQDKCQPMKLIRKK